MNPDHIEELIRNIQQGDRQAENALISLYLTKISRRIRLALGSDNEDWKDLVEDTFVSLLESLREGKFDWEKGKNINGYIYGIALHKVKDYYRRRGAREKLKENLMQNFDQQLEQKIQVEDEEMRNLIRHFLAKLDKKHRELLYLKYYEGLSASEIGKQVKLPPRKVSQQLNYALKLLRKECAKNKILSIFTTLVRISL